MITLTDREQQVLELIAAGLRNKEIADRLGITLKTMEKHYAKAAQRLGLESYASNRVALAVKAGVLVPRREVDALQARIAELEGRKAE